jgi:hypothetical protein
LAGGERREFKFNLAFPHLRLLFPWTHEEPNLYRLQLKIDGIEVAQVFGVRDIRASIEPGQWEWSLNGRRRLLSVV